VKVEAIAELLEVLAFHGIDGVYTDERRLVERLVLEGLERRIEALGLGIEILHYGVRDVHAPPEVHAAFRDVASAQEDKETSINVALRYLDETVNLARGEAAREIAVAGSYKVQEVARAEGESVSLVRRAEAYRRYPVGTFTRLYLETMEEVLADSRKFVRPGGPAAGTVDLWISPGGKIDDESLGGLLRGSRATREERTTNGENPR
jgi:membrane protease subunit HflK